jgi:hypothetical protein
MIAQRFPKADIHTILDAIGSDSRINHKYLRAGASFGGPCFPRDNRLLALPRYNRQLDVALLDVEDGIGGIALPKYGLLGLISFCGSPSSDRCEEFSGVKARHCCHARGLLGFVVTAILYPLRCCHGHSFMMLAAAASCLTSF